jgi:hypothetical protein
MAEEKESKETKETKTTTKRKYTRKTTTKKKEPVEAKEPEKVEEVIAETEPERPEFPDPAPEAVLEAADVADVEWKDVKPEKLDVIRIDENIAKSEGEIEELRVITTGDLKRPKKPEKAETHNPEEDVMITTADFKPRKWGKVKKL